MSRALFLVLFTVLIMSGCSTNSGQKQIHESNIYELTMDILHENRNSQLSPRFFKSTCIRSEDESYYREFYTVVCPGITELNFNNENIINRYSNLCEQRNANFRTLNRFTYTCESNEKPIFYINLFGSNRRSDYQPHIRIIELLQSERQNEFTDRLVRRVSYMTTSQVAAQQISDGADRAERERHLERERQAREQAIRDFETNAQQPKQIGIMICHSDNRFGYVERIENERIQIRLTGTAQYGSRYAWFTEPNTRRQTVPLDQIIWDVHSNWAPCNLH